MKTQTVILGAAIILILFLWMKTPAKKTELEQAILDFVKKKEGGLSKDPTDSAAKNPVPDGSGYHTNKGVTWGAFNLLGKTLGYDGNDIKLFYQMPDDVWNKIILKVYFSPFSNYTISKVCNYYLGLWAWGSGITGAENLLKNIKATPEALNNKIMTEGETATLRYLVDERIKFFKRLVEKKPELGKYLKGWTNVAENFYNNFKNYIK